MCIRDSKLGCSVEEEEKQDANEVYGGCVIRYALFTDVDIIKYNKLLRLRWAGYLMRMTEDEIPRKSRRCSWTEEEREASQSSDGLIII